ncbi:MAG: hypothetical protein Q9160_009299 [Pyrenula sp. 1 TL-2023]
MRCLRVPTYDWEVEAINTHVLPDRLIYDMAALISIGEYVCAPNDQGWSAVVVAVQDFYPPEVVYEEDFEKSIQKAESLGICKNRLWNLLSGCLRGCYDLPTLMAMIDTSDEKACLFRHTEDFGLRFQAANGAIGGLSGEHSHGDCTPDLCHFSSLDCTRVAQRHKCSSVDRQSCYLVQFPPMSDETMDDVLWYYRSDSSKARPCIVPVKSTCPDCVAISHVWSDGTGAGVQGKDLMNECLFRFFCDIAKILECGGIWWDAISILSEPKLRKVAIRNMHFYFHSAKHTVVHDEYLMRIPWKDDGTPCLALILSPWFTRGWTALELAMSKSVKVLFKDPDNDRVPLMKDLRNDVLANRMTASLGHQIASAIVRNVWRVWDIARGDRNLWELTDILKTRSTSWPRDRIVIAALLSGIDPAAEKTNMQASVMKQIVTSYSYMNASLLVHGSSTIADHGSISWCPTDLFSRTSTMLLDDIKLWHRLTLQIDPTAALEGIF